MERRLAQGIAVLIIAALVLSGVGPAVAGGRPPGGGDPPGDGAPPEIHLNDPGGVLVFEGGATDTYRVKLHSDPGAGATVTVVLTVLGTPAQVTVTPASLEFLGGTGPSKNWNSFQVVTVSAVDDLAIEGNHSAVIRHTANGGSYSNITADQTVRIRDNDSGAPAPEWWSTIQVDSDSYSVNEGDDMARVTVTRTPVPAPLGAGSLTELNGAGPPATVVVSYATTPGTAVSPGDYGHTQGTLTWTMDDFSQRTIAVPLVDDAECEPDEFFTLGLSDPVNAGLGQDTTVITIGESDCHPGWVEFADDEYRVDEDAGTVTLWVVRGPTGGIAPQIAVLPSLSVDYRTVEGTAGAPDDYRARTGTLTWAPGDFSPKPITVPIIDDDDLEGRESFTVILENPVGVAIGETQVATVYIRASDQEPGTVGFAQPEYVAGENDGTVLVRVVRTRLVPNGLADRLVTGEVDALDEAPYPFAVSYTTVDGSAVEPDDYTFTEGRLWWARDDWSDRLITVPIVNDAVPESDEVFTLILYDPLRVQLGEQDICTVTISGNDRAPGTVEFRPEYYEIDEGAGTVTLTVTRTPYPVEVGGGTILTAQSSPPLSVEYRTEAGSAGASGDYADQAGTLYWERGDWSDREITILIDDDQSWEPDEEFTVRLFDPEGVTLDEGDATAQVTIHDDDEAYYPSVVEFEQAVYDAYEGDGSESVTLYVTRTPVPTPALNLTAPATTEPVPTTFSVDWAAYPGTALTPADYDGLTGPDALSGTIAWDSLDLDAQAIALAITNDWLWEPDESFTVVLTNPQGVWLGETHTAAVIIHADGDCPGVVRFVPTGHSVSESGGTATLTVTRTPCDPDTYDAGDEALAAESDGGDGTLPVFAVNYQTVDGTAVAGSDYTAISGTLSWAYDDWTSRTIAVSIINDSAHEGGETFTCRLDGATTVAIDEAADTATVTIGANDQPPPSPPPPPQPPQPPPPTGDGATLLVAPPCCVPPVLEGPLTPLPDLEGHWAAPQATLAAALGVIPARADGRFHPDDSINRAEFIGALCRTMGLAASDAVVPFADVRTSDPYYVCLQKAIASGVVRGYEDATFRPWRPITRVEALATIARAMIHCGHPPLAGEAQVREALVRFADADQIQAWFLRELALAAESGVAVGRETRRLFPLHELTRAEAATALMRFRDWLLELEAAGD